MGCRRMGMIIGKGWSGRAEEMKKLSGPRHGMRAWIVEKRT